MKKKQLLATLVMLSLMQGSAYATNWTNEYVVDKNMTWGELTQSTGEGGGLWARGLMANEKLTILNEATLTADFNNEHVIAGECVIYGVDFEQLPPPGEFYTGEILLEGGTLHAIATKKSKTYAIWNYKEYAPEITIKNTNLIFDNYQMGVRFDNGLLKIENDDAFEEMRNIAFSEGILVGISSGAALKAADILAKRPENKGKTIVVLLPDSGDRYLSTPVFAGKK